MKAIKTGRSTLLALALAALAIGLVIVMGARLERAIQEEIVTHFSQRQLLLAEQTAAGIQSTFDEARRDMLHIKEGEGLTCLAETLGTGNEEEIATCRGVTEQGFSSYLRSHSIYTQIRYINASGQEIAGVDSDGETVRLIPQDQLRSQAERDFFVATKQLDAQEVYVSPLEPALGHGEVGAGHWTIRLITPIFDSQGRRAGIVVLNLLDDEIRAHVARLSTKEGVDAWVMDETGLVIANVTHPEQEGSNAYEYCRQTSDETLVALAEDMMAGGQGTWTYLWPESAGGPPVVKRLMAYAPVYPAEGHVWSVATSVPYDSVLAAHHQTRGTLLFLGGGIITIVLASAVLAVRSGHRRAVAEERARLSEILRRRSEELEALREISLAISAQLELDELLHNVVERGCRLLGVKAGGIYLVEKTKGDLELIVCHGYTKDHAGTRLSPGEGVAGKVLQSGAPLIVDDYSHWEGRSPDWETESLTAVLGVPLKRGEQVIGVLNFDETARTRNFDEHDLWLVSLFANQAAIAVENARLYQTEQHGREVAEALQETARVVNASLSLDEVLPLILEQLAQVIEYDSSAVLLLNDGRFKVTAGRGFPNMEAALRISFGADEDTLSAAVMRTQRPLIIADVQADPRWRPDPDVTHIHGWIGAPLIARDEIIGILTADSRRWGAYSEEDGQLVFTFANQAAVAIENARLYEQAQHRLESLTNLNRASQVVTSSLDVKEVLEQIVDLAGSVVSSDYTSVVLLDEEEQPVLGIEDFRGVPPVARRIRSRGITRYVLDSGQTVVVDTISDDGAMSPPLRRPDGELIEANPDVVVAGMHSFAAVPIQAKERTLGILFVHSRQPRAFHGRVPLLTIFANQAAVAIENARLYEQAQQEIAERKRAQEALERRANQLAAVGQVGRQITSLLELAPLLDRIVNLIREAFGYHYVFILLIDSATGELALRAGAGYDVEAVKALRLRVGAESICGWVATSGEPLLVGDVSQESRYYPVEALAGTRSELAVPIQVKEHVVGVLDVQSAEPDAFDEDDLFTLRTLADQVAAALENAELYRELRNYAEQLEQRVQERTAQLQAQYARLDVILRSTTDGIVVTDAGGEIIRANPVAQTWLTQTLSPEDAARLREAVRDLAQQAGERPEAVLELTGLDLELKAAPVVKKEAEEPATAVVAVHDVSHLKALDRMKSHFVSNVSHELRTPITTIKLYAALMQRSPPEKWEKYLDALAQEADRQARLVEDILQISRIDTGRLEMEPRTTSLNQLTEETVVSHQVLAQERGLTIEHRPVEPGPTVLVDPERMIQVLSNLAGNAIRYTSEGGKVVISTGKEEAGGRVWATATVADTGMGIPEQELPHIFERFFRGEGPRTMQISGTGLGLAIVKEIVELHGGQVKVESKASVGTTFTVWLPLAKGQA